MTKQPHHKICTHSRPQVPPIFAPVGAGPACRGGGGDPGRPPPYPAGDAGGPDGRQAGGAEPQEEGEGKERARAGRKRRDRRWRWRRKEKEKRSGRREDPGGGRPTRKARII